MRKVLFSFAAVAVFVSVACGGATPPAKDARVDPEYDRLCAGIAPEEQARCPMAWVKTIEDEKNGVVMHLDATAPAPPELEKRMKCHRAWMAHDPKNDMPGCPLGSPGIEVTATAGAQGSDLHLAATSEADVTEVRRRTHARFDK